MSSWRICRVPTLSLTLFLLAEFISSANSLRPPQHQTYSSSSDDPSDIAVGKVHISVKREGNISASSCAPVTLQIQESHVLVENGILRVNFSKPGGFVTGIQYNSIDNLLEILNDDTNRGYWDMVWSDKDTTRKKGNFDRIEGTKFEVILQTEDQVELSFKREWNASLQGTVAPLNVDKRFIVLRGSSGFYTYGIYERSKGWPEFEFDNTRIAFKLRRDKFHYMAVSDTRQRYMPLPDDRELGRGITLAYPEAVLLDNPIEPEFRGEVDDKYFYTCESRYNQVHGWISQDQSPVGFWLITPSYEFRSGGPLKQWLTSHVGPTCLSVLHSTHYVGADLITKFGLNDPWKKVYGPIFIYLNSMSDGESNHAIPTLWEDAKEQVKKEVASWPYNFPATDDFPRSDQRGTVRGKLLVLDRYAKAENIPAEGAYIGLAAPGEVGSWQIESKGYQFWTTACEDGSFIIENVRAGMYKLNAWVPGFIGEFQHNLTINIKAGSDIDLGKLEYEPPRNGTTLWEIGCPDRTAAEFYIPSPNPKYINKLYLNQDRFRQYGLWERYADLYPDKDLSYTVGENNYKEDWFFAQNTRNIGNQTYQGTTWRINFCLDEVDSDGIYTLRLALAAIHSAQLRVWMNSGKPLFSTAQIGNENAIARHGIHGLYRLFNIQIPGSWLVKGPEPGNTIYLTQASNQSPFQGIMYDYIRLEGPPPSKRIKNL